MFQYRVKSNPGADTYLDILGETDVDFEVLIVTLKDGYDLERRETMPKKLFESCLRTGYLSLLTDKDQIARISA